MSKFLLWSYHRNLDDSQTNFSPKLNYYYNIFDLHIFQKLVDTFNLFVEYDFVRVLFLFWSQKWDTTETYWRFKTFETDMNKYWLGFVYRGLDSWIFYGYIVYWEITLRIVSWTYIWAKPFLSKGRQQTANFQNRIFDAFEFTQ